MNTAPIQALHDIHTATNDVLTGYREMQRRAQPEIQAAISRLTDLHQRHASEQKMALEILRESAVDDSSLQGTINRVVVVARDWAASLDQDVLPAVRMGEESLRDIYNKALEDPHVREHSSIRTLLQTQLAAIGNEIGKLPKT